MATRRRRRTDCATCGHDVTLHRYEPFTYRGPGPCRGLGGERGCSCKRYVPPSKGQRRTYASDEIPTYDLAVKIGTLAHNRAFSPREVTEYARRDGQATVKWLVSIGLLRRVGRGQYYPTPRGWEWIEAAYRGTR